MNRKNCKIDQPALSEETPKRLQEYSPASEDGEVGQNQGSLKLRGGSSSKKKAKSHSDQGEPNSDAKRTSVKVLTSNNENLRPAEFNTTDNHHGFVHSYGNQNGSAYEGDDISSRKSGLEIDTLVEVWVNCLDPLIQYNKRSVLAQTIQDDKFSKIKTCLKRLNVVCREDTEKETKTTARQAKGNKQPKEDKVDAERASLIEQIAQLVEHLEIMQQETTKQSRVCSDKIAVNNKSLVDFIGELKRKSRQTASKKTNQESQSADRENPRGVAKDSDSYSDQNEMDISGIQLGDGSY